MYTIKRNWVLVAGCIVLFQGATTAHAQENSTKSYDKWSVEFNAGQSKGVKPYSIGYYSSNPNKFFNFSGVNHFDLGVRYMFNTKFGFKVDAAMDKLSDQSGSGSLAFKTQQMRFGFQGVVNLGRMLDFESFTNRFTILGHAGLQVSRFSVKEGVNKDLSEDNGGIMLGLTPQLRLTNWLVLTGDFTAINNVRQHLAWDGNASGSDNNLSGLMFNTSLGLTFYLGKQEKHADWYVVNDQQAKEDELKETKQKIAELETKMNDTDRDGIVDYLDTQNNTPAGVVVDSKGRFIDTNRNGVPDELEKITKDSRDSSNSPIVEKSDAIKSLFEKGYLNIFFDVNQDNPNAGSTNNVYHIINFLRSYPDAKAKLVGYADVRGNESKNKDLSQRRAQRLYAIIIASGINASRVTIEGQGVDASYPADSKIGLDLARRVSVIIE
ncbi:OmpA family protein [Flavobacterium sp.]|uniref:OmpA family protein n=1 Tax=Flavobacterium sp. TaxID=239 RepID=UPI000ED99939|nr:OmpA family protein [Flavobacterium sp.]HCQ14366.1 hypothetical protein [Flavobacterium sp.]